MAINTVNSKGITDATITEDDIAISNAPADGKFLQYKDSTDKLTWTTVNTSIADDSVAEVKLDISNAPADGKYLQYKDSSDKLTWSTVSQYTTPLTTRGDVLFRDASGDQRLAKGTDGQFLKIGANDPVWADVPAGTPTGGNSGANKVFWENEQTVTHDYTISNNRNAGTWGPVTINSSVTVTIGDGEYWTIM